MKAFRNLTIAMIVTVLFAPALSSQVPAKDPSARLREVLPADVAQRVLARIADARARQLPAEALENRALKFAAKGVDPTNIERSIVEQADRMQSARTALADGRGGSPKGVNASSIALLARRAPSGRSLAVPLFVIGSLTDRGLPSDQALQRVLARLASSASDADLESMPGQLPAQAQGQANRPASTGRDFGQSHKPASAGRPASAGPPAGVPGNAGKKTNPGQGHKPPARK